MAKSTGRAVAVAVAKPVVRVLDADSARRLTDEIRATAEHVWALLLQAHEQRAWSALGYGTWAEYVKTEFDYSRSRSYQLLDQAFVLREIEGAVREAKRPMSAIADTPAPPMSPIGDTPTKARSMSTIVDTPAVTEYQARALKPHLGTVTKLIREKVAGVAPERVNAIVTDVVEKEVAKARRRNQEVDEANEWVRKVNATAPPGFDAEEDRRLGRVKTAALDLLRKLTEQPDPAEVVALLAEEERQGGKILEMEALDSALSWLTSFAEAWYVR